VQGNFINNRICSIFVHRISLVIYSAGSHGKKFSAAIAKICLLVAQTDVTAIELGNSVAARAVRCRMAHNLLRKSQLTQT